MSNPLERIWQMIFGPRSKIQKVNDEIGVLREIDEKREVVLHRLSDTLMIRSKELDRIVEQMKEQRRGRNE